MRLSQLFVRTSKDIPADADIISQQLMLRAGLIQKLGSGLYTWLPMGLRVLHKVSQIVREEMNRIAGQEVLMPAVQPATLWQETDRWDKFGPQLLKIKDRHARDFCFGPTHEEVVTDVIRQTVQSYRELPFTLYQIQTKFRDEIRPRFGVMRAREFMMKDAYSFHADRASLQKTYDDMYTAYSNIFTRIGLTFRAVLADTGAIGGHASHEFHVLAQSGEDLLAYSDGSNYAANVELANDLTPAPAQLTQSALACERIPTPNCKSVADVATLCKVPTTQVLKTIIVKGRDVPLVALLLRGEDELNPCKAVKISAVADPLTFASEEEIITAMACTPGSLGPIGLTLPCYADHHVFAMHDFLCGANHPGEHYHHICWERDVAKPPAADLRTVKVGDLSPDGKGTLQFTRGIEVGHIFQLGTKYSIAMNALVTDENGARIPMEMGCYGIGISRIVAACIEQHHDDRGIIWPQAIAPYHIIICALGIEQSKRVQIAADALYHKLTEAGFEVLLDDRALRPGAKFADSELFGIPHRLVISERTLDSQQIEYKARHESDKYDIHQDKLLPFLHDKINAIHK